MAVAKNDAREQNKAAFYTKVVQQVSSAAAFLDNSRYQDSAFADNFALYFPTKQLRF
jgi:hypothetical protein